MAELIDIVKADIISYLNQEHLEILFNERDFQMHLATYLKDSGHYDDVDLEYFVPNSLLDEYKEIWDTELRLDVLISKGDGYCPVELKYKTKKIEAAIERFGEQIDKVVIVKNQGAQDLGMYDFWKDVKRVEMVKERFFNVKGGLSVFLTNDRAYKTLSRETSNNREFCMREGWNSRSKHWQRETSITLSRKGFNLSKEYYLNWEETRLGEHAFYYCIAEI